MVRCQEVLPLHQCVGFHKTGIVFYSSSFYASFLFGSTTSLLLVHLRQVRLISARMCSAISNSQPPSLSAVRKWRVVRWFYHFTVVLVFTNSCVNPLIYAAKYREFQHGVRRLVSKLKKGQQQQLQISSVT